MQALTLPVTIVIPDHCVTNTKQISQMVELNIKQWKGDSNLIFTKTVRKTRSNVQSRIIDLVS